MKFILLLIFLVSCGKEIPTFKPEKFVNNLNIKKSNVTGYEIENFHQIKGVMTIHTDWEGLKYQRTEFQSITDLANHTNKLLSINSKFLIKNSTFDERMKLFLKKEILFIDFLNKEKEYEVDLNFSSLPTKAKLLYISTDDERDLGFINLDSKIYLTGQDLIDLFNNKAFLIIAPLQYPANELKKNYFRVYYKNQDSKVIYVSQESTFEDFLTLNNIDHARNIDEINLLTTQSLKSLQGWWFRKMSNGDYVLVFEDISKIQQTFINSLVHFPFSLVRNEGQAAISSIYADNESRVLLKLTGTISVKTFNETYRRMPKVAFVCHIYNRNIKGEKLVKININDLNQIEFNSNQVEKKDTIILDENHFEILFKLNKSAESLSISLPEIYGKVELGDYLLQCENSLRNLEANKTSPEKLFELKGEAFVERRRLSF